MYVTSQLVPGLPSVPSSFPGGCDQVVTEGMEGFFRGYSLSWQRIHSDRFSPWWQEHVTSACSVARKQAVSQE